MGGLDVAIDIGRESLLVATKIAFPILLAGLVVGVIISILQTATQIQEQTLTFVPKIAAVVITLFLLMPWLLQVLLEFTEGLFGNMATIFR
jgi:flagellar biosynthetic protein FliQ